ADKACAPGVWETIAGKVELGEHPIDAVGREIGEECGLSVRIDPRPVAAIQARRGHDPMILIIYHARHVAGEPVLSREHSCGRWLTADEFARLCPFELMHDLVRRALGSSKAVDGAFDPLPR